MPGVHILREDLRRARLAGPADPPWPAARNQIHVLSPVGPIKLAVRAVIAQQVAGLADERLVEPSRCWIVRAWPFFRINRLATLIRTRFNSSVRAMPRSARSLSR